jgi:hypothetical protein
VACCYVSCCESSCTATTVLVLTRYQQPSECMCTAERNLHRVANRDVKKIVISARMTDTSTKCNTFLVALQVHKPAIKFRVFDYIQSGV